MMDKIREFFNKLSSFLFGEEVEKPSEEKKAEYYVPLDERTIKYLPEWAMKEIASVRAYAKKLEEENEKLKEEIKKLKGLIEEEELKEIRKLSKVLQEKLESNKYYILLKFPNKVTVETFEGEPIYVMTSNKTIEEITSIVGLILEHTDYGPLVYLIGKTDSGEYGKIPLGLLQELPYIIKDFNSLVWNLKRGKITIYKDRLGRRVPYAVSYQQSDSSNEESESNSKREKYVVIEQYEDVLKQYPELREALVSLYNRVNELVNENIDLKKEIEKLKEENSVLKATNQALLEQIQVNRLHTVKALEELGKGYKSIADTMATNIQLQQRVIALESGYEDLITRIEDLIHKYHEATTKLPDEYKRETKKAIKEAMEELPWDIIELGMRKLRGEIGSEEKSE